MPDPVQTVFEMKSKQGFILLMLFVHKRAEATAYSNIKVSVRIPENGMLRT
jgi:hypothetical protein